MRSVLLEYRVITVIFCGRDGLVVIVGMKGMMLMVHDNDDAQIGRNRDGSKDATEVLLE